MSDRFVMEPPRSRHDFRIAVVCALPMEAEMVLALFDYNWTDQDQQYGKARGDPNVYTTGLMARHNVVLTCSAEMGIAGAARVAHGIRSSFEAVEVVFLVGLCGVSPVHPETQERINLGDCVISTSVVQYDFGRQYTDGFGIKDQVEDRFGRPTSEIRAHIASLKIRQARSRLATRLSEQLGTIVSSKDLPVQFPGHDRDRLYPPDYQHEHHDGTKCDKCVTEATSCQKDCEELACDSTKCIPRLRQQDDYPSNTPLIHLGRFGSASCVMRSGLERDKLVKSHKIAAFEMEAAGLWDSLPSVLIKSACDYADSHKNKEWQPYAAACAASCLKALLGTWELSDSIAWSFKDPPAYQRPPAKRKRSAANGAVYRVNPNQALLGSFNRPVSRMGTIQQRQHIYDSNGLSNHSQIGLDDQDFPFNGDYPSEAYHMPAQRTQKPTLDLLKDIDAALDLSAHDDDYSNHLQSRLHGTCEWILGRKFYQRWLSHDEVHASARILWLHGPAGTGKTILSASIVSALSTNQHIVQHFFCAPHARKGCRPDDIIKYWIANLARSNDDVCVLVYEKLVSETRGHITSKSEAWVVFKHIATHLGNCIFVLDGLDEYQEHSSGRADFLKQLKLNSAGTAARILITSRDEPDVRSQLAPKEPKLPELVLSNYGLDKEDTHSDIIDLSTYIVAKMLPEQRAVVRNDISATIISRCDSMFLWINLIGQSLHDGYSPAALRRMVEKAPRGLQSAYERKWQDIMNSLDEEDKTRAIDLLRWCTFSLRPLTVGELAEALLVQVQDNQKRFDVEELPSRISESFVKHRILNLCGSFLEIRKPSENTAASHWTVNLNHASVRDFLVLKLPVPSSTIPLAEGQWRLPSRSQWRVEPDSERAHHFELAKICIRYLCYANVVSNPQDTSASNQDWMFFSYALHHWFRHGQFAAFVDATWSTLMREYLNSENINFQAWITWRNEVNSKLDGPYAGILAGNPFYYAAAYNLTEVMEYLHLERGYDIDAIGGSSGTALQATCHWECMDAFKLLLTWNATVNLGAGIFGSALCASAANGNAEMVRALLAAGADPNLTSSSCKFASLSYAAAQGNSVIIRMLLDSGADTNFRDGLGNIPLVCAAMNGHTGAVEQLLTACAVAASEMDFADALVEATSEGHSRVAELLLANSATVDCINKSGDTPLTAAARSGRVDLVRIFLDRYKANVNVKDPHGRTALSLAAARDHRDMVQLLLDYHADASIADDDGWSAISRTASAGNVVVFLLLLDHDHRLANFTHCGWTLLHIVAANGHYYLVQKLMDDCGIKDLSLRTDEGFTPLHLAAHRGWLAVVKLLLDRKADPNELSNLGASPLYLAALTGKTKIIECLLEYGAVQLQLKADPGWTPLIVALHNDHIDAAKLLIKHASVEQLNTQLFRGRTALHCAVNGDDRAMVRLLLENNANPILHSGNLESTPLHRAVVLGLVEDVRELLSFPQTFFVRNKHGNIPLDTAVAWDQLTITKMVLAAIKRLDPSTIQPESFIDHQGRNALHIAARFGNLEILDTLLDSGLLSVRRDKYDRSLLYYACMSQSKPMIEKVLKMELDVGHKPHSWTPLHWICRRGSFEMMKLLVDHGFRATTVNVTRFASSWTPLDIAICHGNKSLVSTSDGTVLKHFDWASVAHAGMLSVNTDARSAELIVDGETALEPFDVRNAAWCGSCRSFIPQPYFKCLICYKFNLCMMCMHDCTINQAHPDHEWMEFKQESKSTSNDGKESNVELTEVGDEPMIRLLKLSKDTNG